MSFNLDPGASIESEIALPISFTSFLAIGTPSVETELADAPALNESSRLIQVKRGLDANLPAAFLMGEPAFTTDTFRAFFGTGSGRAEVAMQGKAFTPQSMTDAAAANNTVYYSTTQNKLVYKDSGGVVNNLY